MDTKIRNRDRSDLSIFGFIHVATIGNWRQIVAEQCSLLHSSGLKDKTERLFMGIVGPEAATATFDDPKIEIIYRSVSLEEFEFPTIRFLHQFCGSHDCLVFYIHTKGVSKGAPSVQDWRRYMEHFVIERHADCISALRDHDVCGVNWLQEPWPHFSGNFWWATSRYVRSLVVPEALPAMVGWDQQHRHQCERWIGSGAKVNPASLHQSNLDHYVSRYQRSAYTQVNPGPRRVAVIFDDVIRPDTTGVYCLNALRRLTEATHVLPSELGLMRSRDFDLYLFIDDGLDYEIPEHLHPSSMWAIDTHLQPERILRRAAPLDFVFTAQREGLDLLKAAGIRCLGWLPLACDPDVHHKHPLEKKFDVSFVAHLVTPQRRQLSELIQQRFPKSFVGQCFFEDMAMVYSASRIVLNASVGNDINMRVFEALACGSLLITNEITGNGFSELFQHGKHLVTYQGFDDLVRKVEYYLEHDKERETIAVAGQELCTSRHTYRHRMDFLLRAVSDQLPRRQCSTAFTSLLKTAMPPDQKPTVSILIPTFNQLEHTRRCLDRLRAKTPKGYEIIVVDNGSSDGTVEYLRSCHDVKLLENAENRGVPAALNQAIAAASGDCFVVLNNDTLVTEGWLDRLCGAWTSSTGIGIVGPCSNNAPDPQAMDRHYPLDQLDAVAKERGESHKGLTSSADVLGGFCMLIDRKVVDAIGGFDEGFGLGTYDDYDFCRRAADRGIRLLIAHDAMVHHVGSVTLNALGTDVEALLRKNEHRMYARNRWGQDESKRTELSKITSIIIVTFNGLEFTKLCLDSVTRETTEAYEVIVVDNASTDGTVDYLRTQPHIRLILNGQNHGFPAAVNQGIRESRGDAVVLLNNDVVVSSGWLTKLRRALDSASDVGLVGPLSNVVSGAQQMDRDYPGLDHLDSYASAIAARHGGQLIEVPRLVGFCLLLQRQAIVRIGLFDERFGIGNFEDDDYCLRARACGYRPVIAMDCFVHHFGSATFKASQIGYADLMARNRQLFLDKWANNSQATISSIGADGSRTVKSDPRISLCMIVRDSAQTLAACLQSVRPWVDEIIVVDTGSVDKTPEIAARFGAVVRHFPWCDDFAAARNQSITNVSGDWIFWMDSDDTIDEANGQKLRELLRRPHARSVFGFVMQVHCPATPGQGPYATETVVDHVKLFRNIPEIRFSGRIHEQVLPAIRRLQGDVEWTDIHVLHSGSDLSPEGRKRKQSRDLRILQLQLTEDPDNTFTLFNVGMTLIDMGRPEEALGALARSLQLATNGESHIRKIYALLTQAYTELGRASTAMKTCLQGLEVCPLDAELMFRKGVLEVKNGDLKAAERSFLNIVQCKSQRQFSSIDKGIQGIKVWHNLAMIYHEQRRIDAAMSAWERVLAHDSSNLIAWRGLLETIAVDDEAGHLATLLTHAPEIPPEIRAVIAARQLLQNGDVVGAVAKLEQAMNDLDSVDVLEELCHVLFHHGSLDQVQKWLEKLASRSPRDCSVHHNLGITYLKQGNYMKAIDSARRALELRHDYPAAASLLSHARAHIDEGNRAQVAAPAIE